MDSQSRSTVKTANIHVFTKWQSLLVLLLVSTFLHLTVGKVYAQPDFFNTKGCVNCHTTPVTKSCNACHKHGANNISGSTDKTSYAPGETVSVAISGGSKTGWVRAVLYDQNMGELARSNGNASGMGSATTLPAVLAATGPTSPGTYRWKVAWYGNAYGRKSSGSDTNWIPDPSNPNHGEVVVSTNSFMVTGPPDNILPTIHSFILPSSSSSLTVTVTALEADDNIGVTGYLVTTDFRPPVPTAAGWKTTAPTSVTAPAAGPVTFYAWVKDAAGNVSVSSAATVSIVLPIIDKVRPKVTAFTLPPTSTSLTVPVSSFIATDNIAVTGYLITTSKIAPAASAVDWSATVPTTATATSTSKAGKAVFYAWAKDASGRVSRARKATVKIVPVVAALFDSDVTKPTLAVSTLPDGAVTPNLTLNVSGLANDEGGLPFLTINGNKTNIAPDGSFSSALTLVDGVNVITVSATDEATNQSTVSRVVTLDRGSPELDIAAPADNLVSAQPLIHILGRAAQDASVAIQVNDSNWQFAGRSNDDFSADVFLVPGLNTVVVTATDAAGNISSAKRTIIYDDSKPTIAINNPDEDVTTENTALKIEGIVTDTSSETVVSISFAGQIYTPTIHEGTFTQSLTFTNEGSYSIMVAATDAAGHSSSIVRNVIFKTGHNN